jgi:hypothetical protein
MISLKYVTYTFCVYLEWFISWRQEISLDGETCSKADHMEHREGIIILK